MKHWVLCTCKRGNDEQLISCYFWRCGEVCSADLILGVVGNKLVQAGDEEEYQHHDRSITEEVLKLVKPVATVGS